jgi:hypothetical protein
VGEREAALQRGEGGGRVEGRPRREPVGDLTAAHEQDGILAWRWWTPGQLAGGREAVWPPQLPGMLAAPPGRPVHLG